MWTCLRRCCRRAGCAHPAPRWLLCVLRRCTSTAPSSTRLGVKGRYETATLDATPSRQVRQAGCQTCKLPPERIKKGQKGVLHHKLREIGLRQRGIPYYSDRSRSASRGRYGKIQYVSLLVELERLRAVRVFTTGLQGTKPNVFLFIPRVAPEAVPSR